MAFIAAGITIGTKAGGILAASGLYVFLCSFMDGAEITPLATRVRAASLGVAMQFITEYTLVQVTPVATAAIGAKYYIISSITNLVSVFVLYFLYPEAAGLSLEGVDRLFNGNHVIMRRGVHVTHELGHGLETGSSVGKGEKTASSAPEHIE
ncbi:hypothetical protein RQP46_007883 [Phenoliferia psychrophenolica]